MPSHERPGKLHVGGRPYEAERYEIDPLVEAEGEIFLILLAQRRRGDGDARQVDSLVLLEHTAVYDLENDLRRLRVGDDQLDAAVVHQNRVADPAVVRQRRVRGRDALGGSLHMRRRNRETLA